MNTKPKYLTPQNHYPIHESLIYDVVISGGGPVGLFLACELALAGCSVLILEQSVSADSPFKRLPFGVRGLSAPSIDALERRGLLSELQIHKTLKSPHAVNTSGPRRQVGHFAGIPFDDGDIDRYQWKYRLADFNPPSLISEMHELETVFSRRAETLGVTIMRGLAVTSYMETENHVEVVCGEQRFNARWLVGCDGSRSKVRKCGGFEFDGTEPEFTGYSLLADLQNEEQLKPGRNMTDKGMYLQSQPGYLMVQDFDGGAFHDSKQPVTLAHAQNVLQQVSGTAVRIRTLHTASTWTDRARQVRHYRKGRVLLAGDAAHIHAPLGGQGLNLGMGDAMNLGWKLAATIQNRAPKGLLDSYHEERHPIGEQVLDWSRAQALIMKPDPDSRAMHQIISDLMQTRDGATYFAARVWGVNTHYDLSDRSVESGEIEEGGSVRPAWQHPLIGFSAPHFAFETGVQAAELMKEGKGLLLDFHDDPALASTASLYKLNYVSSKAKEQYGLSALLLRPDGIVVWASENPTDIPELQRAAKRWFVPDREG
jgi:2-polyprenyl-6-methoxyphenol hydroxylase-like FAD-dependent oxidoreductase